jgi:HK97 family phage major capsid protein
VPAGHLIPASGGTTPTVTQIDADARKAEMALLGSDVLMTNVRWIMSPREFTFLRDLRDANGNLVYPGLSQPTPTWKGFPVEVTNQIPRNLGGTEDEAEIYLVDFDLCLIADSYQVRIDASENAASRPARRPTETGLTSPAWRDRSSSLVERAARRSAGS